MANKELYASDYDIDREVICLELLIDEDHKIYYRETAPTYKAGYKQAWKRNWVFTTLTRRDIVFKSTRQDSQGEPLELIFRGLKLQRVKCSAKVGPRKVKQ